MHQIEDILEIMETQREVKEIQELTLDNDESSDGTTRTVATNSTK